jgi:hypothetical protein
MSALSRDVALGALTAALRDEARIITDLDAVLLRQRAAIAARDYQAVEASVQAMSRIVFVLDAAGRRRAALAASLAHGGPVSLADLEARLGGTLDPSLRTVRAEVRAAAATVATNIRINTAVMSRAIDAGDDYLRQLFSEASPEGLAYRLDRDTASPSVLVNRQA